MFKIVFLSLLIMVAVILALLIWGISTHFFKWNPSKKHFFLAALGGAIGGLLIYLLPFTQDLGNSLRLKSMAMQNPRLENLLPLLEHPEISGAILSENMSKNQVNQFIEETVNQGMPYLDPGDLAAFNQIKIQMAEQFEGACRFFATGSGSTKAKLVLLIETLPPLQKRRWYEITNRAGILALEQDDPPKIPTDHQTQMAYHRFFDSLTPGELERVKLVIEEGEEAHPDDSCWAFLTMTGWAVQDQTGHGDHLLRSGFD